MSGRALLAPLRECVAGIKERCAGKLRRWTSRLSSRQRIALLAVLFATLVAVDIIYIVQGFMGGTPDIPEIEHLQPFESEILKPNHNDTIPQQGAGR